MSVLTNQVHLKIQFRHIFDQKCPLTDSLHRLASRFARTSSVPLEISTEMKQQKKSKWHAITAVFFSRSCYSFAAVNVWLVIIAKSTALSYITLMYPSQHSHGTLAAASFCFCILHEMFAAKVGQLAFFWVLHNITVFENHPKCRRILAFSTHFWPIKTDLSGNTVWPQASVFQKLAKLTIFGIFN